ncbi:hypothetical protein SRHO_G00041420 [Serrasalmus rhombeus]
MTPARGVKHNFRGFHPQHCRLILRDGCDEIQQASDSYGDADGCSSDGQSIKRQPCSSAPNPFSCQSILKQSFITAS